jgi:hypothetical protein
VPRQKEECLSSAHGVITKVLFHVGSELAVNAHPVCGRQQQLTALVKQAVHKQQTTCNSTSIPVSAGA